MRLHLFILAILACDLGLLSASDQIPGSPQKKPIAIVGATIHTVSGPKFERGSIVFDEGRIVQVGMEVSLPPNVELIDGTGKHVYPSLIEAYSDIGLIEINSIPATSDDAEIGSINANVKAAVAFNPDSELIPVNRANGILLAVAAPSGGLVAGRSSLMMLDGWTWEDMSLQADTGMHIRWPRNAEGVGELSEFLDQTRRYVQARTTEGQPKDLRLEAMSLVLDGKMPIVVSASSLDEIEAAVSFASQQRLRLIINGGYDALLCADLLRREAVPVILAGVYRTPRHRHSAYDEAYTLPLLLEQAGIQYCISAGGRFGANGIRNLPYNAATAAAYGLSEAAALRAITLSPAEILGVSQRVGSLQVGLDATLFVADGDILETPTQVEAAFIQGRRVDLDNKHKQLYRKYSAKAEQQSAP